MKKTPTGTSVGVADPYEHAGRCDHVTDDGKCRYAFDFPQHDPEFAAERRAEDFRCPVADGDWTWADCPHYRSRASERKCERCGLEERRDAHSDARPLLEEHHLSYADQRSVSYTDQRGESAARANGSESTDHGDGGDASDPGEDAATDSDEDAATDDEADAGHEITVYLCRWCHAKIHNSWAAIDDDASPDPEAVAAREGRRSDELEELSFETAADRYDRDDGDDP